jgi:predicted porin
LSEALKRAKTLVALAALASISAFAQSSVTLYGGLDTGIVKTTNDDGTYKQSRSYTGGNAGYTSRIGVKGEEDLGGGNKATFNWESAMGSFGSNPGDNSALSNSQANGLRTAQLAWVSPTAGTVTAGYGMNARHVMAATVAQNDFSLPGNISLAASLGGNGNNFGTTGGVYTNGDYTLRSNAVSYTSPSLGGLNLIAGAVLANNSAEKNADGSAVYNGNANAKVLGGIYANGPLTLLASYTRTTSDGAVKDQSLATCVNTSTGAVTPNNAACGTGTVKIADGAAGVFNPNTRNNSIYGGLYDLGVAKLGFAHFQDKLINDVTTASDVNNRGNVFTARGVVSGNWEAFGLYSKGKYQKNSVSGVDRAQSGYQLAGYYNFSKRTAAYVAYGVQKRENATAGAAETKDTMSTIGLRHNF